MYTSFSYEKVRGFDIKNRIEFITVLYTKYNIKLNIKIHIYIFQKLQKNILQVRIL